MYDSDRTMAPGRSSANYGTDDMTMPGQRDRKPEGRFSPGDMIMGRYKVLAELGQGGMGVVYKCFDEDAGIEIALKALPPELSHNAAEMEDIRENFQLVSKLVHQNIAISKNLEKDRSNGNYYVIMECCRGEDLRRWLKRKRREAPLTLDTVLPVVKQVAEALDYAHKQMVIHRDIKPGNIMIAADGSIKVLDFGLAAQIHSSMTRVSMAYHGTSGTGPYMAPEQWRGRAQGAPADQYALAVMTYEMLAGHLPFEGGDAAILREAVLNDTPEDIPGIPSRVQAALRRAMSKDPNGRFETCNAFAAALSGQKTGSGGGGGKIKLICASIGAALLLAAGSGYFWYRHQETVELAKNNAASICSRVENKKQAAENLKCSREQKFGIYIDRMNQNFERGKQLFNSGKYQEAAAVFSSAGEAADWIIKNDPLRRDSGAKIARVRKIKEKCRNDFIHQNAAENYQKAADALKKAEEKYNDADFSGADSYCLTSQKLFSDAREKAYKNITDRHFALAEKHLANNDFFYAEKEISSALKIAPDSEKFKKMQTRIRNAKKKQQALMQLAEAEKNLRLGRYDAVDKFLAGDMAKFLKDDFRVRRLAEKLEPAEFFSDSELKEYILRKCRYIKGDGYDVRESVTHLSSFNFKDFNNYAKQRNLISDCITVGSGVNAVKYLHEKHKVSISERFGWIRQTVLLTAAMKNNYEVIKYLVEKGVDVNARNTVPYDAVKYLVCHKKASIEALKLLISKGAAINQIDKEKKTLADLAASFEVLQLLLENGVKLTDPDDLFRKAAAAGKTDFIKRNMDKVLSVNDIICHACKSGDIELIKLLERSGCRWDGKAANGQNAIHFAITENNDDTVFKYALSRIPGYVNTPDKNGYTPLMAAASRGNFNVVKALVENYKADVNAVNNNKISALGMASSNNHLEIIRYLAKKGAAVDIKNKWGQTPLIGAIASDKPETVGCLLECGADTSLRDNNGWTSVHMAVSGSKVKILKLLLKHKAPVNLIANPDSGWETALMSAVSAKNLEMVELLVEAGADIKYRSSNGSTALRIAENGSMIKKYLIECMDDPSFTVSENTGLLPEHIRTGFYAEARSGDTNAMVKMGDVYIDGRVVTKNIPLAIKYFKKAAAGENKEALRKLGKAYLDLKKNTLAFIWMKRAADNGDAWGMYDMGEMYMTGVCVKRDYNAAYKYFRQAVNGGVDMAWGKIGLMEMYGLGRSVNFRAARDAYKKSTGSYDGRKAEEAQEAIDFAAAPNADWLFPVYGIMPGKITLSELKSMSSKVSYTEYTVKGFDLHFEKGKVDRVMLTCSSDKWPGQWYALGYNPGMSFNEWKSFLASRGYRISIVKAPNSTRYQGNLCFSGRLAAERLYPVNHKIELDFSYMPNAGADDRNTLYSCYIWFRDPPKSSYRSTPVRKYTPPPRRQAVKRPAAKYGSTAAISDAALKRRLTGKWFFYGTSNVSHKMLSNNRVIESKQYPTTKHGELFNFLPNGKLFFVNIITGSDKGKNRKNTCRGTWECRGGEVFITMTNPQNNVTSHFKAVPHWRDNNSMELKYDAESYKQMLINQIKSVPRKNNISFGTPEVFYKANGNMVQVMYVNMTNDDGSVWNSIRTTETSRKIFNRRK